MISVIFDETESVIPGIPYFKRRDSMFAVSFDESSEDFGILELLSSNVVPKNREGSRRAMILGISMLSMSGRLFEHGCRCGMNGIGREYTDHCRNESRDLTEELISMRDKTMHSVDIVKFY